MSDFTWFKARAADIKSGNSHYASIVLHAIAESGSNLSDFAGLDSSEKDDVWNGWKTSLAQDYRGAFIESDLPLSARKAQSALDNIQRSLTKFIYNGQSLSYEDIAIALNNDLKARPLRSASAPTEYTAESIRFNAHLQIAELLKTEFQNRVSPGNDVDKIAQGYGRLHEKIEPHFQAMKESTGADTTGKLEALKGEVTALYEAQKETLITGLATRANAAGRLRDTQKIEALGNLFTTTYNLFGDSDTRVQQARTNILEAKNVMRGLLEYMQHNSGEYRDNLLKALYPADGAQVVSSGSQAEFAAARLAALETAKKSAAI